MHKARPAINQQQQELPRKKHEKIVKKINNLKRVTGNLLSYIENNSAMAEEDYISAKPTSVSLEQFLDDAPQELNQIRDDLIQIQNKLFIRDIK